MRTVLSFVLAFALALPAVAANRKVHVNILNAIVKDAAIAGAEIILQKNGERSVTGRTDGSGDVSMRTRFADDAAVTLIAKKPGFSTLVAKCPCDGLTYAMSPVMHQLDGLRIVLDWGAGPPDLDGHLVFPGNHVYFFHPHGADANQDIDHTTGFGPETITITKKHAGEKYVYAVHDFTNRNATGATALSDSEAKVFVYVGSTLVRTYTPPRHQRGNLWVVFGIGANGSFHDLNRFTDAGIVAPECDANCVGRAVARKLDPILANDFQSAPEVAVDQVSMATQVNKEGEAAYHHHRLDDAISLYQEAIGLDPEYGQAYSNLGLAFRREHRDAEALWADRKAIALAHGPTQDRVRANAYYDMGEIYEREGAFYDALASFQQANAHRALPVYRKAIAKLEAKLR